MDRFKLEELIGQLGNFEDDIEMVLRRFNYGPLSVCDDEIADALIGIKTLHKLKREETFRVLEHLIEEGDLK